MGAMSGPPMLLVYDCTTVTTRPIEARMVPTRTHSVSGAILTTALPVLWTCQASSQPSASLHAMAFWSWRTTCSKVWHSQLCRTVIHGGATASSTTSSTSAEGATRSASGLLTQLPDGPGGCVAQLDPGGGQSFAHPIGQLEGSGRP